MFATNTTEGAVGEGASNSLNTTEGAVEERASNSLVLSVLIPMMILGMMGNTFVLIIYMFRMKPSNHRTFIIALGGLDMCVCSIAMPLAVVKYWRPPENWTPRVCMAYWILNYFMILSSSFTLLLIAVERYRKLCVPHRRQISRHLAVKLCVAAVFIAFLLSFGAFATNDCAIETGEKNDTLKVFAQLVLLICLILFAISISVIYTIIWYSVHKRVKCLESNSRFYTNEEIDIGVRSQQNNISSQDDRRKLKSRKQNAVLFFLITVILLIGYIPYCVVEVLIDFGVLSSVNDDIRYLTRFCVYINHITNCFLYSCFDLRFRDEVKALFNFCKLP